MPFSTRQYGFINSAKNLPAYSGWSDDEIQANITDVFASGDSSRINGLTSAFGGFSNYQGWQPEEISQNVSEIFEISKPVETPAPVAQTELPIPETAPIPESPYLPATEEQPVSTLAVEQPDPLGAIPRITSDPESSQQVAEELFTSQPEPPPLEEPKPGIQPVKSIIEGAKQTIRSIGGFVTGAFETDKGIYQKEIEATRKLADAARKRGNEELAKSREDHIKTLEGFVNTYDKIAKTSEKVVKSKVLKPDESFEKAEGIKGYVQDVIMINIYGNSDSRWEVSTTHRRGHRA